MYLIHGFIILIIKSINLIFVAMYKVYSVTEGFKSIDISMFFNSKLLKY